MAFLFSSCSSLLSLPDISKWNLDKVKNINGIFSECSSLIFLPDISNWLNYKIEIDYIPNVSENYKFNEVDYLDIFNIVLKILEKIYHIYFIIAQN